MPFAEHRGGGKQAASVATMESRWDAAWSGCANQVQPIPDLTQHETWRWIQEIASPPARVLEAGCGFAKWVAFLDSRGYETYGLDYSQTAIDRSLAAWPDLRLTRGDLRTMPYEDNYFDAIISLGAIEHDINGPEAALADMFRVLRPGGMMYCTVPCINWVRRMGWLAIHDWMVCNPTIRRMTGRKQDVTFFEYVYTPAEYKKILTDAGFEVTKQVTGSPFVGSAGVIRRWAARTIYRALPWSLAHMVGAICRKPGVPNEVNLDRGLAAGRT
jgi:ubiquinone/menaquinone biosynthesis C-methylase UbiE